MRQTEQHSVQCKRQTAKVGASHFTLLLQSGLKPQFLSLRSQSHFNGQGLWFLLFGSPKYRSASCLSLSIILQNFLIFCFSKKSPLFDCSWCNWNKIKCWFSSTFKSDSVKNNSFWPSFFVGCRENTRKTIKQIEAFDSSFFVVVRKWKKLSSTKMIRNNK